MGAISRPFPNQPSHYLTVNGWVSSQNQQERYSVISWYIEVTRTGPGFYSATKGWGWDSTVGVSNVTWDSGALLHIIDFAYDWRYGGAPQTYRLGEGAYRVYHDLDGNADWFLAGSVRVPYLGGTWAGPEHQRAPRIGRLGNPPAAPTPISIQFVDQTSFEYRFSGNSDGGLPIREWQIGYGRNPNSPENTVRSDGKSVITNLQPATTYYIWSRGRNDRGWGPWSWRWDKRTLAGATVKDNGTWREAVPYVKVQGEWQVARPYVKSDGLWKPGV